METTVINPTDPSAFQSAADARYLKLDQTTPQEVDNGAPVFKQGLVITAGQKLVFDG